MFFHHATTSCQPDRHNCPSPCHRETPHCQNDHPSRSEWHCRVGEHTSSCPCPRIPSTSHHWHIRHRLGQPAPSLPQIPKPSSSSVLVDGGHSRPEPHLWSSYFGCQWRSVPCDPDVELRSPRWSIQHQSSHSIGIRVEIIELSTNRPLFVTLRWLSLISTNLCSSNWLRALLLRISLQYF